jgi:hypothetical protein
MVGRRSAEEGLLFDQVRLSITATFENLISEDKTFYIQIISGFLAYPRIIV